MADNQVQVFITDAQLCANVVVTANMHTVSQNTAAAL